jgi:hypothetical protein
MRQWNVNELGYKPELCIEFREHARSSKWCVAFWYSCLSLFCFCFPVNQKDCTCIVSTYNHLKKLWENKDKQLYQNATHHLEDRACSRNSIHRSNYRTMPYDKVQNVGLCLSTDWKTWNNINFGYFSTFCQISMDYKKFGPNNILTNLLSQIFSSNTHFKLSLCLLFWLKQKIYSLQGMFALFTFFMF